MTIEERADGYITKTTCDDYCERRIGYIDGATEQKAIDDKAIAMIVKAGLNRCDEIKNAADKYIEGLTNKACESFCKVQCPNGCQLQKEFVCDKFMNFRKALKP